MTSKPLDEVLGIISQDIELYHTGGSLGGFSHRRLIADIVDTLYSASDMPKDLSQNIDAFDLCPALQRAVGINPWSRDAKTLCAYAGFISRSYGYTADKLLLSGKKLAA